MGNLVLQVTRKCRVCSEEKSYPSMVKNKGFSCGVDTICLDCSRSRVKEWRKQNPDKRAIQVKRENGKKYTINKHLWSKYGITHIEYDQMLFAQDGLCKICKRHHTEFSKRLSVDHCHTTGKIRGLLCSSCNLVLGFAQDDVETLSQAIKYLKEHNGTE